MLIENINIKQFAGAFEKSDQQINRILESDAELIRLDPQQVLALTTDNIVEEIDSGLYTDPHQLGWMTVIVNLSDLAAVGADPLGINISINIPPGTNQDFLNKIGSGIADACKEYGIAVLGGDTNSAKQLLLGGTAIGIIRDNKILMRKGAQKGDFLFATGKMGLGNAFAYDKLILNREETSFYPRARMAEGQLVRQFASSCIDTSDGFIPAISNIIEINTLGFHLNEELNQIVDEDLYQKMDIAGIPPWILLAGPHGEFELLFTIPEGCVDQFLLAANEISWIPISLGRAIDEPHLDFQLSGTHQQYRPSGIANLYHTCEGNVNKYFRELLKINQSWLQQTPLQS